MMGQRIVIDMQLNSEKNRSKAMRIATKTQGVNSVAKIGGDQVEIRGYGIDAVKLTNSIRRKVCKYAKLESLQKGENPGEDEAPPGNNQSVPWASPPYIHNYLNPPPPFSTTFSQPVYETYPHPCTIL
ncbi:Heavy metal-associated isoprenylated plant protein 16 [Camellia lanceoleosa]|uniref:Heavy metal-associated isoprenylated plant protein 16 n=1 Tax=Camellia lanceoleosa TaxID=1840588 RepID=A0ACC0HA07_9ERIC|nr:Heavy metal-associated isoprenylated plant protein 16 [Camellia lanceoleosa]